MRKLVEETLTELGYNSPESANLVLGTIAQESAYGKYRKQLGGGIALGICQIEPNTFNDIVNNYLKYHPELIERIKSICNVLELNSNDLYLNDKLSICMCRIHYLRQKGDIPKDLIGQANYYKKYYNTYLGKATIQQYIDNFNRYVANDLN